jgi:uncharacterized protein
MIKYRQLPENITDLIPVAVDYLQSCGNILFAYLFGSLAKVRLSPLSDVDIAVYLSDPANPGEKKLEILGRLIDLLKTDEIDLVMLNSASLSLKMKVLQSRKVIVDSAPFLRHQYESLVMREYFDFSIKEMEILGRRFLHG